MPKLNEFLFGKKGKVKQKTTLTPEQESLLSIISQGLTEGNGPLSDIFGGFNEKSFEEGVTQPALKNFQEKILPQLQEQFISSNQVGGSGQRNAFSNAATDLQSRLAELMYGARQNQQQNRLQGLNTVLGTKAFENIYKPGTEGAAQGFIKGVGQGLGQSAGGFIAGGGGGGGGAAVAG